MREDARETGKRLQRLLREAVALTKDLVKPQHVQEAGEAPGTPTPSGRYHIAHYGNTRNFALYEQNALVAVTVYRKGAEAVQRQLEARDMLIAEQAARIEQLTSAATPSAPEHPTPEGKRLQDRGRNGQAQQLGFFSREQKKHFIATRSGSTRDRS